MPLQNAEATNLIRSIVDYNGVRLILGELVFIKNFVFIIKAIHNHWPEILTFLVASFLSSLKSIKIFISL